jgi:predicted Zn-dependent protease
MRLVEASGQTQFKWEFTVIDDDKTVNAWALPGGKVAVYTGILNLAGDDDALLATVMGHELAHATHRHGAERITENLGLQIITAGAQIVLDMQSYDPKTVEGVMAAFGVAGNVTMLKFSRAHESEADQVGLIYMARAGYHPAKAIEFWQKMSELAGDGGPPEFLSTHPSHETRVENLARWQEEAMEEFQGAQSKT